MPTEEELAAIARDGSAQALYRLEAGPDATAWDELDPSEQQPYRDVAAKIQDSRP